MQSYIYSEVLKLPEPKTLFASSKDADKYEKSLNDEISKLQKDLSKSYEQLAIDQGLLCSFYKDSSDQSKNGLEAASEIRNTIEDIKKWRKEMEDEFLNYATTGWGSGMSIEDMVDSILNPLLQSVEGLTAVFSQMGLGNIPMLGTIPKMLQNFSNVGRIVRTLPKEVVDAARYQADSAKQIEESGSIEVVGGNQTWTNVAYKNSNDSTMKKIVDEIKSCFEAFLDLLQTIASCAEIFAIILIIDKFKPVIDQFKIMVGDAVTILENVEELLKLLVKGKFALIEFVGQLIWSKIEDLWNIIVYVSVGQGISTNALISGCWSDIVSVKCDISAIELSIDFVQNQLISHSDAKTMDVYRDKIDEAESFVKLLKSSSSPNMDSIRTEEKKLESLKTKEKILKTITAPEHGMQLSSSLSAIEFFEKNRSSIYQQLLDQNISLDSYLNPKKEEVKTAP